jgi:thiamine kinase-like enzyme
MQNYILKNPLKLGYYAKMLARLHHEIHKAKDVEGKVSSLKRGFAEVIQEKERLTPDQKKKLLDLLESLPDASCLCHCDFHPQNVLFLKGNPVIIDWMSCVCGDPAADVAGSWLIMNTITVSKQYGKLARKMAISIKKRFNSIYLKTYLKISPMTEADIKKWLPIRAATYLDVGLHEDCNKAFYGIICDYCKSV